MIMTRDQLIEAAGSVSAQCQGLSPGAEKQLRIGDVGFGTSSQMNQNHISDQNIEIMRQLEELREDVRALLTMRREDVEAL